MGKLFGTDGIRGLANHYPITPEVALRAGRALGHIFLDKKEGPVLVGRDPRLSGDMLASALMAGCCASGCDVLDAGVIPTPAVACLTVACSAMAGVVISASHNPYTDNGIKFFDAAGFKLSSVLEDRVEKAILNETFQPTERGVGRIFTLSEPGKKYVAFLRESSEIRLDLSGMHIVMDGANGAVSAIAPDLFRTLGARVTAIFCYPDGKNINAGCGSEHTEVLAEEVTAHGADLGLAFDGDGDRLVAVDEKGKPLTGDQILAILARDMKNRSLLTNDTVVSTIMSNVGLTVALNQMGIRHVKTGVGDRLVMEKMKEVGSVLGGEDSGHIICMDRHTTGDGLLSALRLLGAMRREAVPLSELGRVMRPMPQCLINIEVTKKPPIAEVPAIFDAISEVESHLMGKGRVLVRYSGTQSICRVMVEGPTKEVTEAYCGQIARVVEATLKIK